MFMKLSLQQMKRDALAPPRRAWAMRHWALSLLLLVMLQFVGTPVKAQDPHANDVHDMNLPGTLHVYFNFNFFNYKDDNGAYEGPVYLQVNGTNVVNLRDIWRYISDQRGHEKNVTKSDKKGFIGSKSFDVGGYKGKVALSNIHETSSKWFGTIVDVVFENWVYGQSYKLSVKGKWIYESGWVNNNKYFEVKTYNFPTMDWPTVSFKRTGNNEVQASSTDLKQQNYDNYKGKNSSGVWRYAYRFTTDYQANVAWPQRNYVDIQTYRDNFNTTPKSVKNSYVDCTEKASSVYMTMKLDNYESHRLHPFITRFAPNYRAYPLNGDNYIENNVYFNRSYERDHWVNGYPRPKSISAYTNSWTKNVTITWSPEIADASHVTTDGKWVVFRQKSGSTTYEKLTELAYSDGEVSYVDESTKDYDTKYYYYVAFQPDEWNTTIMKPEDATNLYKSTSISIGKSNPLNSISATSNQDNKITVTCNFSSFQNASSSNAYKLQFYRRVRGTTDWGEVYKEATINDKDLESYSFDDTNVANGCASYQYMAKVAAQETTFSSDICQGSIAGNSEVTGVTASRGDYSGTVRITWNVTQVGTDLTYFNVRRRLLGGSADYQTIYTTSGVADTYTYEDNSAQPGSYYQYEVECYRKCKENGSAVATISPGGSKETDGFALATGVFSGRVSYDTGTAVDSVKVIADANNAEGEKLKAFHALRATKGVLGSVGVSKTAKEIVALLNKPWTAQTYVKINEYPNDKALLFSARCLGLVVYFNGELSMAIPHVNNGKYYISYRTWANSIKISKDKFYHIAISFDGYSRYKICVIDEEGNQQSSSLTQAMTGDYEINEKILNQGWNSWSLVGLWYGISRKQGYSFSGVIDECRF